MDDELEIKAYYAGHVLGAAMFYIRVGQSSVVYTGDYNMTPDRHLGAAWIDRCRPDLLITESTYATAQACVSSTSLIGQKTKFDFKVRHVVDCREQLLEIFNKGKIFRTLSVFKLISYWLDI